MVSLLVGQLVLQYGITPGTQEAVEFAGEAAIGLAVILVIGSLLVLNILLIYIIILKKKFDQNSS